MFDLNWRPLPFRIIYPTEDPAAIGCPRSLEQMIKGAEQLGKEFSFVRVDFYDIKGTARFGEMTFFPDSGIGKFIPQKFDLNFGKLWRRKN